MYSVSKSISKLYSPARGQRSAKTTLAMSSAMSRRSSYWPRTRRAQSRSRLPSRECSATASTVERWLNSSTECSPQCPLVRLGALLLVGAPIQFVFGVAQRRLATPEADAWIRCAELHAALVAAHDVLAVEDRERPAGRAAFGLETVDQRGVVAVPDQGGHVGPEGTEGGHVCSCSASSYSGFQSLLLLTRP